MTERDFNSTSFYEFLCGHRLMASRCASCGALFLPPRPLCTACYGDGMGWVEMAGRGRLVAFTTVHIAPTAMIEAGYDRKNPYCTGVVQLVEGPSISAQIVGVDASSPEEIAVGAPLRLSFVERGEREEQRTFLAFEVLDT